ncbi:MAG: hypothetical protein DBY42_07385 [Bacillota bacterium]|nr:MAG: hypothetical protein DBY42_07385 [Bacillota bacterium]
MALPSFLQGSVPMDFVFFSLYTKIHGVQEKSPGFPGFFAGFFDKHSERGFLQIKAAAGLEHGIVLLLMPDYLLPGNVFDKRGILCKNSV